MIYPHLPINPTKSVILGEKYKDILDLPLKNLDILPFYLPINQNIEFQINSHIDINLIQLNKDILICEPTIKPSFDILHGKTILKAGYPNNISYNGLLIGKHFFHNLQYTDPLVLNLLPKDVSLHNVNQGFAKCMVCIVDETSAITSDLGMYETLKKHLNDVLLISQGHIDLEGYDYGFIGGSSFKISQYDIAFTGTLHEHPDYDKIKRFLYQKGIQIHYLTDRKIFDVGSILPRF